MVSLGGDSDSGTLTVEAGVLTGEAGSCVARYEHDALGRRVFQHRPLLSGADADRKLVYVYGGGPEVLTEYDSTESEGETCERWFVHGPASRIRWSWWT